MRLTDEQLAELSREAQADVEAMVNAYRAITSIPYHTERRASALKWLHDRVSIEIRHEHDRICIEHTRQMLDILKVKDPAPSVGASA